MPTKGDIVYYLTDYQSLGRATVLKVEDEETIEVERHIDALTPGRRKTLISTASLVDPATVPAGVVAAYEAWGKKKADGDDDES